MALAPGEARKDLSADAIFRALPMNFPAWRVLWGDRAEAVSGSRLFGRRVGKGCPAGSIELRVSPSPSKIP